eukprot:gb/GECG01001378.1/.p1 GENE.gb/GECG01001378.1/~~gb/GECG01001378.1/.p1  ORF type:complete len:498 (+),score=65.04 gb/GECG01001378.1/:1-1494(+)
MPKKGASNTNTATTRRPNTRQAANESHPTQKRARSRESGGTQKTSKKTSYKKQASTGKGGTYGSVPQSGQQDKASGQQASAAASSSSGKKSRQKKTGSSSASSAKKKWSSSEQSGTDTSHSSDMAHSGGGGASSRSVAIGGDLGSRPAPLESNLRIYYTKEDVVKLRGVLRKLVQDRAYALANPEEMAFTVPSGAQTEPCMPEQIMNGKFIDKSESYWKGLDWDEQGTDEFSGVRLCCFPRRFGKTTWLEFMRWTLCVPPLDDPMLEGNKMQKFYQAAAALEKGHTFVGASLRPALYFCFNWELAKNLRESVADQFRQCGLRIDGPIALTQSSIILQTGLNQLRHLYVEATQGLTAQERTLVSLKPLVLLDETDYPWREQHVAGSGSADEIINSERRLSECRPFFAALKNFVKVGLWGIMMVTLLRIAGTGLSELDSYDIGLSAKYHGIVGITEEELLGALAKNERIEKNEHVCMDDLFAWGGCKEAKQEPYAIMAL